MGRRFNGTTAAMRADVVDLSGTQIVTASFWHYAESWPAATEMILELSDDYNSVLTGFAVYNNNASNFRVDLIGDVGQASARYTYPSTNVWHHYVTIFDKSLATNEVDLYLDGTLQTPTGRDTNSNNTNNFAVLPLNFMARSNGASLFRAGPLADVAVWNIGLSAANITSLSTGVLPSSIQAANLKGYWKICGNASPEPDLSGNGHNAVLVANPIKYAHPFTIDVSCAAAFDYSQFPKEKISSAVIKGVLNA